MEIRKTGMERSNLPLFPDVPDFLIHFSLKVLGFELGEGDRERFWVLSFELGALGTDNPSLDLDGSKPKIFAGDRIQ